MTDTTAGRGGVGIRVFVDGAQVVRRTFDQIGDSGKKMWAEIALGERSANPAIRALSAGAGEARNAFDGLVGRAGSAGVALGAFGAAGMMAAAALGAVAVATHGAFDAMDRAADLTDAADRIGIGVEALQQWRYVADEAGVDVGKFEGALERLNGVLGKFKMGLGDAKLKPVFEELGITKEQLDGVTTADQLLLMLADTLGQVKDRAQQVALARALGVEEALPAIRLGRDELERLTGAATELGLVLDAETNAALDESQRKLEMANQQMRVARDVAVAPLADAYASVAAEIAGMIVQYDRIESKGPGWIRMLQGLGNAMPWSGGFQRYISNRIGGVEVPTGSPTDEDDPALLRQRMAVNASQAGGGFELRGHGDSSATSRASAAASAARAAAREAEREAEQRRQREERAQQQIERAEEGNARSRDTHYRGELSIDGRALIENNEIQRDRTKALRDIKRAEEEYARSNGLRGLNVAEAEQLRLKQEELTELRENVVETQRRRDLAARRLKDEEDAGRAAIELMDIESQMVRTNSERARIERDILQATIEISRKRKAFELENDPELSEADRRQSMAVFDKTAQRQVELFDHVESERLRAQFKSYGREVVDAIQQGRIGEYIGDKLKERLMDGALDQLFNLVKMGGSGSAGGGGNWMQTAFNFASSMFGGPRAAGGGTQAGRFYTTVEHGRPELLMIGGSGHVTSAAETVRMLRDSMGPQSGSGGAGGGPISVAMPAITISAPGADPAALGRLEGEVRKLRADLPGIAVKSITEARQRRLVP